MRKNILLEVRFRDFNGTLSFHSILEGFEWNSVEIVHKNSWFWGDWVFGHILIRDPPKYIGKPQFNSPIKKLGVAYSQLSVECTVCYPWSFYVSDKWFDVRQHKFHLLPLMPVASWSAKLWFCCFSNHSLLGFFGVFFCQWEYPLDALNIVWIVR